jgi:hypothetical protein
MTKMEQGEAILEVVKRIVPNAILENPHQGDSFAKRLYRIYIPEVDEFFELGIREFISGIDQDAILEKLSQFLD